jgi:uncharacterized protein
LFILTVFLKSIPHFNGIDTMKKIYIVIGFLFTVSNSLAQKNIAGIWEGKLSTTNFSLRLVFHLTKNGNSYSGTMDSPDQGAKDMKLTNVQLLNDSLILEIGAIGGKAAGRLLNDSTFSGQWIQGVSLPFSLKKVVAPSTVNRPQTPTPPFSYDSDDVIYYNKDKSIRFGATVTSPKGAGPFPAMILITGSGQQNRDEELFGHKLFAVLADHLTKNGYVVLRVDDRGTGQTTGTVATATSKDFAGDVMTGLDYLKGLPKVDKAKLGMLGHSEGGMIAQLVAAERPDIDFVIMLAGPGQKIIDLMADQNRAILEKRGLPSNAINSYVDLYKSLATVIAFAPSDTLAKLGAVPILEDWLKRTPKEIVDTTLGETANMDRQSVINEFTKAFRNPWFHYFIKYNPDEYVRKMKAKVLALNGEKDIQVLAKPNLAALKSSLQKSRSKKYDIIELKGLNHLFQHCISCTVDEYGKLEETIALEALETIATWLKTNVR